MDVTEAIQKGFTILVLSEVTARVMRKKYNYPFFYSYRTKLLDAIDGLLIDADCDGTEINIDVGVPVYFSKILDT